MNIRIREMQSEDSEAVTDLSNQLGYAIRPEDTRHLINTILSDPGMRLMVITENEKISGWIQVFQTVRLESGSFCEIGGLVIEEKARGKGLGTLLVQAGADWARQMGFPKLKVRCNSLRTHAHEFYKNNGFKTEKEQKVFYLSL